MAHPSRIALTYNAGGELGVTITALDEGHPAPEGSWVLRLEPDHSVAITHTPLAASSDNPISLVHARHVAEQSAQVTTIASLWRAAHRESLSDLAQYGLVPRAITDEDTQRKLSITPPYAANDTVTESFRTMYGHLGVLEPVVWTTPDADLNEFGCAYLTTRGRYGNAMYFRTGDASDTLQWGIRYVGITTRNTTTETVSWDDSEGLAALARRCLLPAETHAVQAALADSEEVSRQAREFTQNAMIREAREHFAPKSRQIRPILVKKALEAVERDVIRTQDNLWGSTTVENLLSWNVTGREADQIYMCARMIVMSRSHRFTGRGLASEPVEPVNFHDVMPNIGRAIQNKLDERGLGQAGIVISRNENLAYVVVAKNLPEMWEYAEAIGMGDDPIQILTDDRDAWISLD